MRKEPENLPWFHYGAASNRKTWSLFAHRTEKNLMWLQTGSGVIDILLLVGNTNASKKLWISLAKYTEPKFDTEHIAQIDRNYIYIPRNSKSSVKLPEDDDKAVSLILKRFDNDEITDPTLITCDCDGFFLSWNYNKAVSLIDKTFLRKWRGVQKKLYTILCERFGLDEDVRKYTNPNVLIPLGYERTSHTINYSIDDVKLYDKYDRRYPFFSLV